MKSIIKPIKQKILPSAHLYEIFQPLESNEKMMIDVVRKALTFNYYKGIELGILFEKTSRETIRKIIETNNLNLTQFATPYLKRNKMSLCELDKGKREKTIEFLIELIHLAGDTGCTNLGIPSGDDPGEQNREEAKKVLAEAIIRVAEIAKQDDINITLEPLDRYAYKKQLIGPIEETIEWFSEVHNRAGNAYIHWDSAHEALGEIDLIKSANVARNYIAQFHLCNAILDKNHPCYGDLHMDVGEKPDFETWGYLTPTVGADILREIASFDKVDGIKDTYVSVEILGHKGDDLWRKERIAREFLIECYKIAGLS